MRVQLNRYVILRIVKPNFIIKGRREKSFCPVWNKGEMDILDQDTATELSETHYKLNWVYSSLPTLH